MSLPDALWAGASSEGAFPRHADIGKLAEPGRNLVLDPGGQGFEGGVFHVVGSTQGPYRSLQQNRTTLCLNQIRGPSETDGTVLRRSVMLGTRAALGTKNTKPAAILVGCGLCG